MLCKSQELRPKFGRILNKAAQIGLKGPVGNLGLSVRLWVVGTSIGQGSPMDSKQFSPKMANKELIPITANRMGHVVQHVHFRN